MSCNNSYTEEKQYLYMYKTNSIMSSEIRIAINQLFYHVLYLLVHDFALIFAGIIFFPFHSWKLIIDNLISQDKTMFSQILSRIPLSSVSPAAGMVSMFLSIDQVLNVQCTVLLNFTMLKCPDDSLVHVYLYVYYFLVGSLLIIMSCFCTF